MKKLENPKECSGVSSVVGREVVGTTDQTVKPDNASGSLLQVTTIRARNAVCDCPHCGEQQDGWALDPRGRETTCDDCHQPYAIAADAAVSIN